MAYVSSATEGLDCLHSVLRDNLPQVTNLLGYAPNVIWSKSQPADKPPRGRAWIGVQNVFEPDRRMNIGRPKRYEVKGAYNVFLNFDPKGVEFSKITKAAEAVKSFFRREQVSLRPYNVLSAAVNDGDPVEGWNRKLVMINYRFQYFEV